MAKTKIGMASWMDLTVPNAENVKDFYSKVVGWAPEPVDMGGYNDFSMNSKDSQEPVAGVSHKRGCNSDLPSQWLVYIAVENLEKSLESCLKSGGCVLTKVRELGNGKFAVIQDPAGAVLALFEEN